MWSRCFTRSWFTRLFDLCQRGVFWVTRVKNNTQFLCRKKLLTRPIATIIQDDLVRLKNKDSRKKYPQLIRRVVAWVEVDGQGVAMTFMTNNFAWAPDSIADLYKARWSIEAFFKQIKQTLQLCDFLGHNKNAILWQVWTALLLYILLRYLAFCNKWRHSFKRLFLPASQLSLGLRGAEANPANLWDSTWTAKDTRCSRTDVFPRFRVV